MATKAKWKRVETALSGGKPDRPPYGFWLHFPQQDRDAAKLVESTVYLHRRYEQDFVKVMFRSSWGIEDWGARAEQFHPTRGFWLTSYYPIQSPLDWYKLKPLNPKEGVLGEQLYVLREVAASLEGDAPILATLFAPSTLAALLSGQSRFLEHLKSHPEAVRFGLGVITETLINFGLATLENGAHGVFYAIQGATRNVLSEDEYLPLGQAYDRPALEVLYRKSNFVLLHAHGDDLLFEELSSYPAHAINWYDRGAGPTLKKARALARPDLALAGGIDHERTLLLSLPEEIAAEVQNAAAQVDGQGLLLATGCGIPVTVPPENLVALKKAVFQLG